MNEPILHTYPWGKTENLYKEEICKCGVYKKPSLHALTCFSCEKRGDSFIKPEKKSNPKKK